MIEFKSKTGKPSPSQRAFEVRADLAGIKYAVCRSVESAWQALVDHGAPVVGDCKDGRIATRRAPSNDYATLHRQIVGAAE